MGGKWEHVAGTIRLSRAGQWHQSGIVSWMTPLCFEELPRGHCSGEQSGLCKTLTTSGSIHCLRLRLCCAMGAIEALDDVIVLQRGLWIAESTEGLPLVFALSICGKSLPLYHLLHLYEGKFS